MPLHQADLLRSLKIVDLGTGMAPAILTRLLADAGAQVTRFEPADGDPFYNVYPAYALWHRGATIIRGDDQALAEALASADACVIGGEDHPDLPPKPDASAIAARHPGIVLLDIGAYPLGTAADGRPGTELLVQARSGFVFEHFPDRPMPYAFPVASYGAALQGLVGLLAGLCDQRETGVGQVARTSLYTGALMWLGHFWFKADRTDGAFDFIMPKGSAPLIFRCADGEYVHFTMGTTGSRANIYGILGIDDPTVADDPRGSPSLSRGVRNFYGDVDLLQSYVDKVSRQDLLEALWAKGVPAEAVNRPGEGWDDAQVEHNGVIASEADGVRRVGLPIRFRDEPDTALRTAANRDAGDEPVFAGVNVVDFGNFTAGPHASMVLGDLGADIIKVESLAGDPLQTMYRPFTASSRGKRNIAVDMKHPRGLDIVHRLCARADIITHNFRPGVTKRLGIEVETLRAMKPELIVLENSGYGADGPKAERGGIDMIFQAFCGHEHHAAGGGNLVSYRSTTVDFAAGMLGAIALLLAQYRKIETGSGAEISTSLLNTGLFMMSELFQHADGGFSAMPKVNRDQTGFRASERLYQAKDGWIAIVARGETMARALTALLGLEAEISAPPTDWAEREEDLIAAAIAGWDLAALSERLEAAGVWSETCTVDAQSAFLTDPEMLARDIALTSEDAVYGHVVQIGRLFSLSRSATPTSGASARNGQHSRQILEELGMDSAEIDDLYAQKIVA